MQKKEDKLGNTTGFKKESKAKKDNEKERSKQIRKKKRKKNKFNFWVQRKTKKTAAN